MKKMVITGVNGFIGRHAKEYFEKEYEITGLDLAANYCGDRQPTVTVRTGQKSTTISATCRRSPRRWRRSLPACSRM